jgi:hypothetical protein
MFNLVCTVAVATALALAGGLMVRADNKAAEKEKNRAEENRQRLKEIEADPTRFAALLDEFRAFQNLPPEGQNHLRKLDRDWADLTPAAAGRLRRALARYVEWRERLPEDQRRSIDSAPSGTERLRRIRELREQEWVAQLPKAQREQLESVQGEVRAELVKRFRQQEKQRRREWQAALRHWDELLKGPPPTRRDELEPELRAFVEKTLEARLTPADAERFQKAEGGWPRFMETLVELADRYVPFPGRPRPREFKDLPDELRGRLLQSPAKDHLVAAEGRWPEFALAMPAHFWRARKPFAARYMPSKAAEFEESVQSFIRLQLEPRLTESEAKELAATEGLWPAYPKAVVRLATKHGLLVPGMLPLPKPIADRYRVHTPPAAESAAR